ncbi:hypothetical protein ABPG77_008239 [Micractinium sp. CCAP 211/92]
MRALCTHTTAWEQASDGPAYRNPPRVTRLQRFAAAVEKLQVERQHGLMQHAEGVALHLQRLGLDLDTVGLVLQACPALFSFPAEERAEVLLAELMGERCGRSASQAAKLFIRCPALANTRHVMPSIVQLVSENHAD